MEFSQEEKTLFRSLADPCPRGRKKSYKYSVEFKAAKLGNICLIKWLTEIDYDHSVLALREAIERDHLELVKWMMVNRCPGHQDGLGWAAEYGKLRIVKWILETYQLVDDCHPFHPAIEGGHQHIVEFLIEKQYPHDKRELLLLAAQCGNSPITDLFLAQGVVLDEDLMKQAITDQSLEAVQWLKEHNCPWNRQMIMFAYAHDEPEIAKWMIDNCL